MDYDPPMLADTVGFENATATGNVSYLPLYDRPETFIVPILFAVIFIVGCLGNGTLILIFSLHKSMRNVPNTYIFSLALGDLLVIITSVPFTSIIYTMHSWPFGTLICKVSESAKDISIGVSVFTLTALSADRFFAIVDPMHKLYTVGSGRGACRCTLVVVAGIWILSILLAMPAAIFSYLKPIEDAPIEILVCFPFPEHAGEWYPRAVITTKFLVYYALPLLVIAVFYTLMSRHLYLSTRNLPGESARQVRARKKVAKMVLAFVFIFAFCFLPHHVFALWFVYNPNKEEDYNLIWHTIKILGFSLAYVNSCINPIALFCVSGTFRKHFQHYLFCCCKRSMSRSSSMTSSRRPGTLKTSLRRGGDRTGQSISMGTVAKGNFYHRYSKQHQVLIPEVTVTTFMNGASAITGSNSNDFTGP